MIIVDYLKSSTVTLGAILMTTPLEGERAEGVPKREVAWI